METRGVLQFGGNDLCMLVRLACRAISASAELLVLVRHHSTLHFNLVASYTAVSSFVAWTMLASYSTLSPVIVLGWVTIFGRVYTTTPTRSTQHCIPLGSLNRVSAFIGWRRGGNVMHLGRLSCNNTVWSHVVREFPYRWG